VIGGFDDLVAGKIQHAAVKRLEANADFSAERWRWTWEDRKPVEGTRGSQREGTDGTWDPSIVKERAGVKEKAGVKERAGVKKRTGLQEHWPVKGWFWRG